MRLFEIQNFDSTNYVYHASHTPNNNRKALIKSLYNKNLQPSKIGYSGPGTYFAYEPDGKVYDHTHPEYATMLRVKWNDLVDIYGKYPENPDGIQRDDEEITVPGPVPAEIIEDEVKPGVWEELYDVYQELYNETI